MSIFIPNQEEYKPGTVDVLNALVNEYQWLNLLTDSGKPYDTLLRLIVDDSNREMYTGFGAIKKVSQILNESQSKITKWILSAYNDLFELNYENPELFKLGEGHRYYMHFKVDYHASADFTIYLSNPLSYGEAFEWQFIKAKVGTYYFYVEDITHVYAGGTITTQVTLHSGWFNSYRQHLIDKLDFLKLIDFHEKHYLPSHKLDEILKERSRTGRTAYEEPTQNYFKRRRF